MLVRSSQEQWSRSTSPECSKSAPDFMMSIQELSGALRSTRSGWAGVHLPECSQSAPDFMMSIQELSGALRSTRSSWAGVHLPECSQSAPRQIGFSWWTLFLQIVFWRNLQKKEGQDWRKSPSNYQESVSLIKVFHLEMESGPLPLLHLIILSACLCTFPLVFITLSKSIH